MDPAAADPYGSATFHSKDQDGGITGLLEPLLTAVLDVTAVVTGNEWLLAIAAVTGAGESAQNFSEGNVLAGVLDLGTAAGFGAQAVSTFAAADGAAAGTPAVAYSGAPTVLGGTAGATYTLGQQILAGTAVVGGLSGIVGSAENGDGLGVVAATLETAAAVAGGLATTQSAGGDAAIVALVAGIAGGAVGGADAIESGHVADGLLTTLGPLLGVSASLAFAQESTDATAGAAAANQAPSVSTAQTYEPAPGAGGGGPVPTTLIDEPGSSPGAPALPVVETPPQLEAPSAATIKAQPAQVTLTAVNGATVQTYINQNTGSVAGSYGILTAPNGAVTIGAISSAAVYDGNLLSLGSGAAPGDITVTGLQLTSSSVRLATPQAPSGYVGLTNGQVQTTLGVAAELGGLLLIGASLAGEGPSGGLTSAGVVAGADLLRLSGALGGTWVFSQGVQMTANGPTVVLSEESPTPTGSGNAGDRPAKPSYQLGASDAAPEGSWITRTSTGDPQATDFQAAATGAPVGTEFKIPSTTNSSGFRTYDSHNRATNYLVDAKGISMQTVRLAAEGISSDVGTMLQQVEDAQAAGFAGVEYVYPSKQIADLMTQEFEEAAIRAGKTGLMDFFKPEYFP